MDRDSGMPSSAVSQLEDWLASQEEETRRLKVTETINHATLDAAGVTSKLDGPASLGRLPRLDLGDDEAELRTVQLLGKGGMAEVHLARQRALRRDVAIKRLPRGKDSTQAATSLLREARVTGRLEHPNIVPVHMLGCDQAGMPVIVMKRVEGLRWRDLVGNLDPSSWQTTKVWSQEPIMRHLEVLIEVCNAVHFAHSMGVVHRDIKPSNVMVHAGKIAKLGDFGFIKTKIDKELSREGYIL
ncbi:MAG: protein kinase, partial [Myxococcales bacterium]|nr:protein kinase [Myxococcales bacterium]